MLMHVWLQFIGVLPFFLLLQVEFKTPPTVVDEAPAKGEETPAEWEESQTNVRPEQGTSPAHQEEQTTEERLQLLVRVT